MPSGWHRHTVKIAAASPFVAGSALLVAAVVDDVAGLGNGLLAVAAPVNAIVAAFGGGYWGVSVRGPFHERVLAAAAGAVVGLIAFYITYLLAGFILAGSGAFARDR